jgi:hypothetical protein
MNMGNFKEKISPLSNQSHRYRQIWISQNVEVAISEIGLEYSTYHLCGADHEQRNNLVVWNDLGNGCGLESAGIVNRNGNEHESQEVQEIIEYEGTVNCVVVSRIEH